MNLKQLRFVEAITTTGSFTAAAEQCCVTQPTLSNGVAQLEDELGEPLFQRSTRNVVITPFGKHLLPYIKEVLSAQESLVRHANAFLKPEKQLIRIGTTPLFNANILGLIIESYRLQNPNVNVILREMNMTDLNRMLDEGLLDFVFGVANIYKGSWIKQFLYDEPLLFIARGDTSKNLRKTSSVKFKDITNETYVMVPDACGLSRAIRALFRKYRKTLMEYTGEAMSYQVLAEWAALGIGAAILPASKLPPTDNTSLFITDKNNTKVTIEFEALWIDANAKMPHVHEFAKHLHIVVPEIIAGLKRQWQ